jgi:hypothetical protein
VTIQVVHILIACTLSHCLQQTSSGHKLAQEATSAPASAIVEGPSTSAQVAHHSIQGGDQENGNTGGTREGYRALTRSLTRTGQRISRSDLASPPASKDFSPSLLSAPDRDAEDASISNITALPPVGDLFGASENGTEFRAALHRIRLRPPPPPTSSSTTAAAPDGTLMAQSIAPQLHPVGQLQGLLSSTSTFVTPKDTFGPQEGSSVRALPIYPADTAYGNDKESSADSSPERERLRGRPHADALYSSVANGETDPSAKISLWKQRIVWLQRTEACADGGAADVHGRFT